MKEAKTHTSEILNNFFKESDTLEDKKHLFKMIIAAKIDDARINKNMRKNDLANLFNRTSSEITKWLSGNHNFTIDTLMEIEHTLGIQLFNIIINYKVPCAPCDYPHPLPTNNK